MPAPSSPPINKRQIQIALAQFGVYLSDAQLAGVHDYIQLLLKWNRSLSLTSVADAAEIARRHFGESMFAASLLPVENCRLADVGTGAGFPGLPLKIIRPDIDLVLIESNKKKCAFLSEVVRSLGLNGVEIVPDRFELITPDALRLDVITARAVGEFKEILRWSEAALQRRGHIMLWVGAEDSTRISANTAWTWQPPVRLPDSQRRFILIGRPLR
jgi:16S rRNA (guanine527-N7)-methyltransferase